MGWRFAGSFSFCNFVGNSRDIMKIEIGNSMQTGDSGGMDGFGQVSAMVLLVRNVIKSCRAVSSYETACTMILELVPAVASDSVALAELMRGKEEVRAFFEQRNTPQPSTKIEGCNFFTGDTQAEKIVGKDMPVDVNSPGNFIADVMTIDKDKIKE